MSYKKFYTGGTFGPNMTFPDRCYFENCTFLAQCKFGEACDFVNCNFQKCCPKPYSNPNSEIKKGSKLFGCSLEYVTIENGAELYNEKNTGNRVIIQGNPHPANQTKKKGGEKEIVTDNCGGQRINSEDVKKDCEFNPCPDKDIEGYSDVPVKSKQQCCPENTK